MRSYIQKILPKSEFAKNILTLMTGMGIAQAIPILISPILTRIYTPEDFGVLALYNSLVAILVSFSNGGYEVAIVQPKKDSEATNILGLSFNIAIIVTVVVFLIIFFFKNTLADMLGNGDLIKVLYLLPLSLILFSVYNSLNYFNIRKKKYKNISYSLMAKTTTLSGIQLTFGVFHLGYWGLIIGQILSVVVNDFILFKPVRRYLRLLSIKKQKEVGVKYRKFPRYVVWSSVLNTGSSQFPIVLITSFFGSSIAGFFSFSQRIISTPVSLIGNSIGQVFYQKSVEVKEDKIALKSLTFNTYKKLFNLGLIPFLVLTFFADYIFSFIFGEKWKIAGEYTQFLSPWIFFVFISSPLSTIFFTLDKQREDLIFNILIFLSRISSIFIGYYYFQGAHEAVVIYGVTGCIFWMYFCFYILKIAGIMYKESILYTFKYLLPTTLLCFILKFFFDKVF